jgi:hypothetical protein
MIAYIASSASSAVTTYANECNDIAGSMIRVRDGGDPARAVVLCISWLRTAIAGSSSSSRGAHGTPTAYSNRVSARPVINVNDLLLKRMF